MGENLEIKKPDFMNRVFKTGFGCDGKKRFSVKYPDGTIFRTGTCDPKEDERHAIVESEILGVPKFFLVQYQQDDYLYEQPEKQRTLLPDGALIANGFYDKEHDEFVSPSEWIKQQ
jgi:hypothetical protein